MWGLPTLKCLMLQKLSKAEDGPSSASWHKCFTPLKGFEEVLRLCHICALPPAPAGYLFMYTDCIRTVTMILLNGTDKRTIFYPQRFPLKSRTNCRKRAILRNKNWEQQKILKAKLFNFHFLISLLRCYITSVIMRRCTLPVGSHDHIISLHASRWVTHKLTPRSTIDVCAVHRITAAVNCYWTPTCLSLKWRWHAAT